MKYFKWIRCCKIIKWIRCSFIGPGDFFFLAISLAIFCDLFSRLIFLDLTFRFFLSSIFFFVKRRAKSTVEQQKCKNHLKRDRLLVPKVELSYQISSEIKSVRFDPVFSNWDNLMEKLSNINFARSSTKFMAIYFSMHVFKSNVYSEDSYIGLCDFFS